jgi:hypothetical protein
MFIEVLLFSLVIGYIFKGSVKNFNIDNYKGAYLVFVAFLMEAIMVFLINKGLLYRGTFTYCADLIMYILVFIFTYLNRNNKWILIMSIGFILNSIPIFLNGGTMPVSGKAAVIAGIPIDISKEGLYKIIDSNTKAVILADIMPLTFLRHFVISIGDIIAAIGMSLFIITGMKNKQVAK